MWTWSRFVPVLPSSGLPSSGLPDSGLPDSGRPVGPRPRPEPIWVRAEFDQFPAQVLQAADPTLEQSSFIVVRQLHESHKAAVFAVSARARAAGVEPGMPVFVARRKIGRQLRVLPRDETAEQASRDTLQQLCSAWTPEARIEAAAIRLDLSGTPISRQVPLHRLGAWIAAGLRGGSGLQSLAVGVSASRVVAQILARQARPDGIATCPPGQEQAHLAAVDADSLPGLASACRERAHKYGLERVDQLLELDRATLIRRFGRADGTQLYGLARGIASEPGRRGADSVAAETVLRTDVNDDGLLLEALRLTVDKAVHQVRRRHLVAGAVCLQLVYSDNQRTRKTIRPAASTDDFSQLRSVCLAAFGQIHTRRVALKSIQVTALRLSPAAGQRDLFDGAQQRKDRRLGRALTSIRERLGFDAVVSAGALRLADDDRP